MMPILIRYFLIIKYLCYSSINWFLTGIFTHSNRPFLMSLPLTKVCVVENALVVSIVHFSFLGRLGTYLISSDCR